MLGWFRVALRYLELELTGMGNQLFQLRNLILILEKTFFFNYFSLFLSHSLRRLSVIVTDFPKLGFSLGRKLLIRYVSKFNTLIDRSSD